MNLGRSIYTFDGVQLHPDVNKDVDANERFMSVRLAYEVRNLPICISLIIFPSLGNFIFLVDGYSIHVNVYVAFGNESAKLLLTVPLCSREPILVAFICFECIPLLEWIYLFGLVSISSGFQCIKVCCIWVLYFSKDPILSLRYP